MTEFNHPYFILGEGPGDVAFFQYLILDRSIEDQFDICCPANASGVDTSGNTRFKDALNGFSLIPGFDDLKGILLVTDNDENPGESLRLVQKQIAETVRKFHAPPRPLVKSNGKPPIVIIPIPWENEVGNLETLCSIAAESAFPSTAMCADAFQACSGVNTWPPSKRSKVKMRSIVSALNRENSDLSLAYIWKDRPDIIPLSHSCFDRIASLLANPQELFCNS